MSRIIGIVSGKGGVGKTTTTINLSAALMEFKKNVIAVDSDIRMSGLGLQLGMYYFPVTLNDVLMDRGNVYEALYIHSSGLRIIPSSLPVEDVMISRLRETLKDPLLRNNIVLVDAPPGLDKNALAVIESCPELLIITTPEIPAISDAMKIVSISNKINSKPIGIVVNRYRRRDPNQVSIREIELACDLPVIGIIPEDKIIRKSIFKGLPAVYLKPRSPSSVAYKKIAAHLIGEVYEPTKTPILKKFLGRFKR